MTRNSLNMLLTATTVNWKNIATVYEPLQKSKPESNIFHLLFGDLFHQQRREWLLEELPEYLLADVEQHLLLSIWLLVPACEEQLLVLLTGLPPSKKATG